MKAKLAGLGIFVLLWAVPTAASYVPPLMAYSPQLITAGEQVVSVPIGSTDGEFVDAVERGCHHIPFLMRWIAGYPSTVRVEVHDGDRSLGWFRGRCSDGSMIERSDPDDANL